MSSRAVWLAALALSGAASASETTTFAYDALGRLIESTNSGGPRNGLPSQTSYDRAGNRTASSVNQTLPALPPNNAVFSVTGPAPLEESGYAVFTITKSGTAVSDLSVNYATADGPGPNPAVAPQDYTAVSGTLTFPFSATSATVSVLTVSDGQAEGSETFSMTLSSPSPGSTIGTGSATATINASGAANQPPVANPDYQTQGKCVVGFVNVIANDTDPEGHYPLVLVSVTSESPSVFASVENSTTVRVSNTNVTGAYDVNYVVRDSQNASSTGVLTVTWIDTGACN